MNCPYLLKDVIYVCGSERDDSLPGVSRLREYCRGRFAKCPGYMRRTSVNSALAMPLAS